MFIMLACLTILQSDNMLHSFYLFNFRHNSRNEKKNSNDIDNHRSGNESNAEAYTEL